MAVRAHHDDHLATQVLQLVNRLNQRIHPRSILVVHLRLFSRLSKCVGLIKKKDHREVGGHSSCGLKRSLDLQRRLTLKASPTGGQAQPQKQGRLVALPCEDAAEGFGQLGLATPNVSGEDDEGRPPVEASEDRKVLSLVPAIGPTGESSRIPELPNNLQELRLVFLQSEKRGVPLLGLRVRKMDNDIEPLDVVRHLR